MAGEKGGMIFLGSRLVKVLDLGIGGNLYGGRLLEMAAEQGAIHAARSTGEAHLVGYRFSEFYLTRPVVAQDTGGAIRGAIRFDYFWGFGDDAGASAGRQKSEARAWVLIPNGLRPEDAKE